MLAADVDASLCSCPHDVLREILKRLEGRQLAVLQCTCRQFNGASSLPTGLWQTVYLSRWAPCQVEAPDWKAEYAARHRSVSQALQQARLDFDAHRSSLSSSLFWQTWDETEPCKVDFTVWQAASRRLQDSGVGAHDAQHLLWEPNVALALLGIHHLRWLGVQADTIATMVKVAGCGQQRVTVRWWEMGELSVRASFRSRDRMRTVDLSIASSVSTPAGEQAWRALCTGLQYEVHRIQVEFEPRPLQGACHLNHHADSNLARLT